jgi:hypothetical protein
MKKFVALCAAALSVAATPASANLFVVGTGTDANPLADNNDFKGNLEALGLTILRTGGTLALTGKANIRVDYFASESGFTDTFTLGSLVFSETNKSWGEQLLGTVFNVAAGPLTAKFTSNGHGDTHAPGVENFGIFLPSGTVGQFASNVVWIGYDDQINQADDNHDDFIIRLTATAVPEPATWAMMIGGFGMAGAAMRRRVRTSVAFA